MEPAAADIDALLILLFLMHEWKRLQEENQELRALLHTEYQVASASRARLREFRHPGGED